MEESIIQTKDEPKIEFRVISDKGLLAIKNPDINKNLVEISGYDLQVNFNMEYLNSIEDVESAVNGISDLFRELIMEKLLEYKRKE